MNRRQHGGAEQPDDRHGPRRDRDRRDRGECRDDQRGDGAAGVAHEAEGAEERRWIAADRRDRPRAS